jgi:hypothetical protein
LFLARDRSLAFLVRFCPRPRFVATVEAETGSDTESGVPVLAVEEELTESELSLTAALLID